VSGLISAYRRAAESAIRNGEIVERFILESFELSFPYPVLNDVMKILKDEDVSQSEQKFELECSINVNFRRSNKERILERFSRVEGLKFQRIAGI
jgi:putative IMPACT (imprinted ancient) family translation regulator